VAALTLEPYSGQCRSYDALEVIWPQASGRKPVVLFRPI